MQHRVLFFQSAFWCTQIEKFDKVYLINSYTIHSDIFCLTCLYIQVNKKDINYIQ